MRIDIFRFTTESCHHSWDFKAEKNPTLNFSIRSVMSLEQEWGEVLLMDFDIGRVSTRSNAPRIWACVLKVDKKERLFEGVNDWRRCVEILFH